MAGGGWWRVRFDVVKGYRGRLHCVIQFPDYFYRHDFFWLHAASRVGVGGWGVGEVVR